MASPERFVLDCSMTMAWCFEDEQDAKADAVLSQLESLRAVVPPLWSLEVANVLLVAERRRRLTQVESTRFLELLRSLPIDVDCDTSPRLMDEVLALGRQHRLSAYDCAYLELALRHGEALATLDGDLATVASTLGIPLL